MQTIAEYSSTQAALSELKARWAKIPNTDTKAGYALVKTGIKELSGYRTKLEAMRKELKAPILERGKLLDSEAKRITAELLAIETPLKDAKQVTDEREKREKEERIARLQVRVNELINYPRQAQGATSAQISVLIDRLGEIDTSHDYYDLTTEAMDAQAASLDALSALYQEQVAKEAEAKRMAAERARQAEEQARLDAERQAMIAQQEALRKQQEAMEQQMAAQRAEMERNQAELEQQREQVRIEEERRARVLAEQEQAMLVAKQAEAERERLAAERIEIDQLEQQHQAEQAEQAAANAEIERQQQAEMLAATGIKLIPDEEHARDLPRFVAPTQRKAIEPPLVNFIGRECKTVLTTRLDRTQLEHFFGDEVIHDMAYDEAGNEYALELVVHRVRIINIQAA